MGWAVRHLDPQSTEKNGPYPTTMVWSTGLGTLEVQVVASTEGSWWSLYSARYFRILRVSSMIVSVPLNST